MSLGPTLLVWLLLSVGVAAELLLAAFGGQNAVPFIGVALAVLVAFTFMRLGSSRGLVPVFAVAGVFWLAVLLGLGGLDSATRRDVALSPAVTGLPAPPAGGPTSPPVRGPVVSQPLLEH